MILPTDRSISELLADYAFIEKVLQEAIRENLMRHRQLNQSVVVWRDGKVVHVQPKDIPVWPDPPAVSDVPQERPYNDPGCPSTGDEP